MHSVCSSRRMESLVLWSLTVWPTKGLNNFISASSILRLCEAVKAQFSDPYKNVGKTKVLYNFKIVSVLTLLKIVLLIIFLGFLCDLLLLYNSLSVSLSLIYIYIHIYIHTHTHTHIYIYMRYAKRKREREREL
jgi:hypothetical protein